MYANYDEIRKRARFIEEELLRLRKLDTKWPQGDLICTRNEKRFKWYVKQDGTTVYLPKRNVDTARKLAQKKFCQAKIKELEEELAACRNYMKSSDRDRGMADKILENKGYAALLENQNDEKGPHQIMKEIDKWKNEPYEINKLHPETLNVKGTRGKMLRSKSEAIIDKILYSEGIPFRYEDKLVLGNVTFCPDFTIRHPRSGKFYYWEHFGMMDNPEYVSRFCQKIRMYCEHGIIPMANLILTYETKDNPLGIDSVEKIVKEYFL